MNTKTYGKRRARLAQLMPDHSLALVHSGSETTRNHDAGHAFRVDSSFWYLTGFDEPESWLIISKRKSEYETSLYVPPKDKKLERWEGRRLGVREAVKLGCTHTQSNARLAGQIGDWLKNTQCLFSFPHQPAAEAMIKPYLGVQGRREVYPEQWRSLGELVYRMRWIKDREELAQMRKAASINALAHIQCMRQCRPGRFEYQLEAAHRYESLQHGALHQAYQPIVASGGNACILHYTRNDGEMKDGDLVLVDAGCEYGYYASDITRTFPVNGRFTPIQRDLYELVLLAQQHAIDLCRPGRTLDQMHKAARECLTQGLLDMGLLSGGFAECMENDALSAYYMHGTSHWLGLDVHDPSHYRSADKPVELAPGAVLTVEPGLYFDNQKGTPREVRGMGIRIEDDLLVTKDEPEILTVAAPKLPDDITAIIGCDSGRKRI